MDAAVCQKLPSGAAKCELKPRGRLRSRRSRVSQVLPAASSTRRNASQLLDHLFRAPCHACWTSHGPRDRRLPRARCLPRRQCDRTGSQLLRSAGVRQQYWRGLTSSAALGAAGDRLTGERDDSTASVLHSRRSQLEAALSARHARLTTTPIMATIPFSAAHSQMATLPTGKTPRLPAFVFQPRR